MSDWKLDIFTITERERSIRLPSPVWPYVGDLAEEAQQPKVGNTIAHWANKPRACSWFQQAQNWLRDYPSLEQCDAPRVWSSVPSRDDMARNEEQSRKQIDFVFRVVNAIAQGYNALNLVAMNDPMVRRAYHKWISGPPEGDTVPEQLLSWFEPASSFGGGVTTSAQGRRYGRWFFPNEKNPIFGGTVKRNATILRTTGARSPAGMIPLHARVEFQRLYPNAGTHPSEFVITVKIPLKRQPRAEEPPNTIAEYQTFTRNEAEVNPVRSPATASFFGNTGRGFMPDSSELPALPGNSTVFWDWRATFFDTTVLGQEGSDIKLGLVAPMRAYLDYLAEIVEAAMSRSMDQIILDTRVYVGWLNTAQILYGYRRNSEAFIGAVQRTEGDALRQQLEGNQDLRTASRLVGGLGAGIATVLAPTGPGALVGGVIGLISGVASGVMNAVAGAWKADVVGKGVDDMGRWKPVLQRGYLSGDVNVALSEPSVGDGGRVPTPPGGDDVMCGWRILIVPDQANELRSSFGYDWGSIVPTNEDGTEEEGSIVPWLLGAIVLVGGAVVWSRRSKGRSAKR